jgi:Cu/Ag efflux pump CusA
MSLTGIALAIGVIVDNGIIMAENSYKNLSHPFCGVKSGRLKK